MISTTWQKNKNILEAALRDTRGNRCECACPSCEISGPGVFLLRACDAAYTRFRVAIASLPAVNS